MTTLARLNVVWSGWPGGPGINRLVFSPGIPANEWTPEVVDGLLVDVRAVYNAMKGLWAQQTRVTLDSFVTTFDSVTGENVGVVSCTTPAAFIQNDDNTQSQAKDVMLLAQFKTDDWIRGRRLQGRSFIGPIAGQAIQTDGAVTTTAQSTVANAYTAITSGVGPRLAVYQRPNVSASYAGAYGDVAIVTCWSKPAVLRSRRD